MAYSRAVGGLSRANWLRAGAAILGLALLALEVGHTWQYWRYWVEQEPVVAPLGLRINGKSGTVELVEPAAEKLGVAAGDRILSVDGAAPRGDRFLRRAARAKRPGDTLVLEVVRGQEAPKQIQVVLQPADRREGWNDHIRAFFIEILSRWMCLVLGLYVVLARPLNVLAWIVLGMLSGFARVANTLPPHYADTWPLALQSAAVFIDTLCSASWPGCMLLFGLLFPDPNSPVRLFGWTRWVLGLPAFLLAPMIATLSLLGTLGTIDPLLFTPALRLMDRALLAIAPLSLAVFFANIPYKAANESSPDGRRRLRLFFVGANLTLLPLLVLVIADRSGRLDQLPSGLMLILLCLVSLFPAVVGYLIVVQRAMDVRVVVRQGLQYALATRGVRILQGLLTGFILLLVIDAGTWLGSRTVDRLRTMGFAMIAIVLLGRFANKAQAWLDRRFFRDQMHREQMLLGLGQQVRGVVDAGRLRELVTSTVRDALNVGHVELALASAEAPRNGYELTLPLETPQGPAGWLLLGPKLNEEPYTRRDVRLLESVASQAGLALENARLAGLAAEEATHRERIQHELRITREVQERIFPQRKPVVRGLDYAGLYQPAGVVGGDCFEYLVDQSGRLWLAIGDVAGKGVPAALLMAGVNAALRSLLAAGVGQVDLVMNHLNRVLYDTTPRNRFVTLLLAMYEPDTRRLHYASAGHCPLLLLRGATHPEWLSTRGVGLGLTGRSVYRADETQLQAGDIFVLYTDGVTEARNQDGEEFGEERLVASAHGGAAAEIAASILAAITSFTGQAAQHDDITVLVARCTETPAPHGIL